MQISRFRLLLAGLAGLTLAGCATLDYYAHAVNGHLQVLAKRRPIQELVDDPATKPELKEKLALVLRVRDFASSELLLPDNRSYRSYADLERPFVVWNVFAAPELSLEPKEWCFPIIGCVAYRGYFSEDKARAFTARLKADGLDVYVGGVSAYSTLGWFHDPVLNTMIHLPRAELAGIIFHELAHQKLFVKNDTTFNESFATVVEMEGVRRWLAQASSTAEFARYRRLRQKHQQFVALVIKYQRQLETLYASPVSDNQKRIGKKRIFSDLRSGYRILKKSWAGYRGYDRWFTRNLNNAQLVPIGSYYKYVPALQALLQRHQGDLGKFFQAAEALSRLDKTARVAALETKTDY